MQRFLDSCQHYGTSTDALKGKWSNVGFVTAHAFGGDRNSGYISFVQDGVLRTLTHQTRYIVGARLKSEGNVVGGECLQVANNTRSLASVNINPDRTVSLLVGGTTTPSSEQAISDIGTWHFYEMDVTVGAAGTFVTATATIHIDNFNYGTFSGTSGISVHSLVSNNATVNQVGVSGGTYGVMDFYCFDGSATDLYSNSTTNTAMTGDIEVDAVYPATDVGTGWVTSGGTGTSHFNKVNEVPPNGDTSYVFTTATGSHDSYNYQSISTFTGDILGAQYLVYARKDNEGSRVIAMTVGTNTTSTLEFLTSNNYLSDYYVYYISEHDTDFGTPWDATVFDAEVFGITMVS